MVKSWHMIKDLASLHASWLNLEKTGDFRLVRVFPYTLHSPRILVFPTLNQVPRSYTLRGGEQLRLKQIKFPSALPLSHISTSSLSREGFLDRAINLSLLRRSTTIEFGGRREEISVVLPVCLGPKRKNDKFSGKLMQRESMMPKCTPFWHRGK